MTTPQPDALLRLSAWLHADDHNDVEICCMGDDDFCVDTNNESVGIWVELRRPTLAEAIHAALDCYEQRKAEECR